MWWQHPAAHAHIPGHRHRSLFQRDLLLKMYNLKDDTQVSLYNLKDDTQVSSGGITGIYISGCGGIITPLFLGRSTPPGPQDISGRWPIVAPDGQCEDGLHPVLVRQSLLISSPKLTSRKAGFLLRHLPESGGLHVAGL